MSPLTVKQAARRLNELDKQDPQRNGLDLFITASGGYGSAKQAQLLADIRTLVAEHVEPPASPFGDTAA
jgi:hypothetical protein